MGIIQETHEKKKHRNVGPGMTNTEKVKVKEDNLLNTIQQNSGNKYITQVWSEQQKEGKHRKT